MSKVKDEKLKNVYGIYVKESEMKRTKNKFGVYECEEERKDRREVLGNRYQKNVNKWLDYREKERRKPIKYLISTLIRVGEKLGQEKQ